MRVILVFIDGLGLGRNDPETNPLAREEAMPSLGWLMGGKLLGDSFPWRNERGGGVAADAVLGVPGLPQSATGQTTLLTGKNAQSHLGRHQNGFPGSALRQLLAEHSIFRQIGAAGRRGTFANAFTAEYFAAVATGRWRHSVTTLSALAGGVALRFLKELRAGQAVYQDLTRENLRERGYDIPLTTPEEAGLALARIALEFDFTLFEYFQTDLAGHGRRMDQALERLGRLDAFLGSLLAAAPAGDLVVVASDHGNIEDLATPSHTANPVPILAFGRAADGFLSGLTRLDQVTPGLMGVIGGATA